MTYAILLTLQSIVAGYAIGYALGWLTDPRRRRIAHIRMIRKDWRGEEVLWSVSDERWVR